MLRRVLNNDDEFDVVLLCDSSVWGAQLIKAREIVETELVEAKKGDFIDCVVDSLRSSLGGDDEFVRALAAIKSAGREMIATMLDGEERDAADNRLREALSDEDLRTALAWVRAQAASAAYRSSSDVNDLLDPDPDDATKITLKPVSRETIRKIERAAGAKNRLGALHYSHASDKARQASRRGEDSTMAFAEYLADLDDKSIAAVESFEDWQNRVDYMVAADCIVRVHGFDELCVDDAGRFPVDVFASMITNGPEVFSEIAHHSRQVGALGKSARLPSPCSPGMPEHDGEREPLTTGGPVTNASEDEHRPSRD